LVEWQLRVASGEELPLKQEEIAINGHAIEARLYAEDPANGFLPSTGYLEAFDLGKSWSGSDGTLRFEMGVEEGDAISPYYDPMIAKVIAHAADRETAICDLSSYLNLVEIWPVRSNAPFLWRALDHEDFKSGQITTAFIETHLEGLIPSAVPGDREWNMAARAILDPKEGEREKMAPGFRLNANASKRVTLYRQGECRTIFGENIDRETFVFSLRDSESVVVFEGGAYFEFQLANRRAGHLSAHDGAILAPMPGKVIALDVAEGQEVAQGQRLMVLEAMKMEHALTAPFAGRVAELPTRLGAQVEVEALLARIEQGDS
jgi:3-methylcrotonyl-CoA carboxylase alpha subunit